MLVEIYSDIACPWCYIGEKRFSRALSASLQRNQVEVVYRPFQLDPSLPATPIPLKERLQKKFGSQLQAVIKQAVEAGRNEGLEFRFEKALAVNTFTPHRLLWLAEKEAGPEVQRELAEKLFEAHFTNGDNIGDSVLLAELAASVGMDRKRVEAFLTSNEGSAELRKQMEYAYRLGIRAVPTFVFNGESAVQGAQPPSTFLQVLEKLQKADTKVSQSLEACTGGACSE